MCFCEVGDFHCQRNIRYHTCPSIKGRIFVCNGQKKNEETIRIAVIKIHDAITDERRGNFSMHAVLARESGSSDWTDFFVLAN